MNVTLKLHDNFLLDVSLRPANAGQLITLEFNQAFPMAQHPRWQRMAQINAPPEALLDIAQLLQIGAKSTFLLTAAPCPELSVRNAQPLPEITTPLGSYPLEHKPP